MPELLEIEKENNVDRAAELLTAGLTRILDIMAPIKTIQIRENYAPHLTEHTKKLQTKRNEAQAIAAKSGDPSDWRQ